YKSPGRLQWESDFDCIAKMREWLLANDLSDVPTLEKIEDEAKKQVLEAKKQAWNAYLNPFKAEQAEAVELLKGIFAQSENGVFIEKIATDLASIKEPIRKDILVAARKALRMVRTQDSLRTKLGSWITAFTQKTQPHFSSHLFSESDKNALMVKAVAPQYAPDAPEADARLVLRDNFDALFEKYPNALIFGEDSGKIGDVNQGLEGMQEKYGEMRVADAGIREATILGQGIGMAMRGLRPIAEIQYLDYLLYAIQIMSDDLATLQYRTKGRQKAPVIIRTRGHRLE